jgi:hypothetical protein
MADPCVVKSGEVVSIDDPRLSDTGCTIEAGVIIRPPVDETTVAKVETPAPIPEQVAQVQAPRKPKAKKKEEPKVEAVKEVVPVVKKASETSKPATKAQVSVPPPEPKEETYLGMSPEMATVAAVGAVAAVGGAVATSTMGGFSAIQAKLTSLFGSKATATVAGGAVVTAGMIVAVKALESKMGSLEKDMNKAKEEVGGAASSIDRIDALLSRLGGDNDDKLDPSV